MSRRADLLGVGLLLVVLAAIALFPVACPGQRLSTLPPPYADTTTASLVRAIEYEQSHAWTPRTRVALGATLLAEGLDCASTAATLRHPGTWEWNPVLGRHPSTLTLAAGCLVGAGFTAVVADLLPNRLRGWFLGPVYAIETWNYAVNLTH